MDMPQPLKTSSSIQEVLSSISSRFLFLIFFQKLTVFVEVQMKETPSEKKLLYLFLCASLLFPSTAGHIEVGLQQRGTGMNAVCPLPLLGRSQSLRGELLVVGLASQVALLHNPLE